MTFKKDWERASELIDLPPRDLKDILSHAYPNMSVRYNFPRQGCANLNIVIEKPDGQLDVLRIYYRDPSCAYLEESVHRCLSTVVPIPEVKRVATVKGYTYAIHSYLPGILLRDLVLSQEDAVYDIMFDLGELSGRLFQTVCPPEISALNNYDSWKVYLKAIENKGLLSSSSCQEWSRWMNDHRDLLTTTGNVFLHGDLDPSNILVEKVAGRWRISGILDWEFAHIGSPFQDIAHMLIYRREVTPLYTQGYLNGVQKYITLPQNLSKIIDAYNAITLIESLANRTDAKLKPNRYRDIINLLDQLKYD
jgi:Ser/Thr protein kinase RdoA (MazF antagonist)